MCIVVCSMLLKHLIKVHYVKLFNVFISRDIHPHIVRIIINSYIKQKARISWGSYTTPYFDLCNAFTYWILTARHWS